MRMNLQWTYKARKTKNPNFGMIADFPNQANFLS